MISQPVLQKFRESLAVRPSVPGKQATTPREKFLTL